MVVWYDIAMGIIYITGVSGMGKSQVLKELQARGLEAHGVDEDMYGDWINRETGAAEELEFPEGNTDFDIHDWYKDHAWVLSRNRVAQLATKAVAKHQDIFLCGTADGFDECKEMFSKVFALHMDDAEGLSRRIQERTDVDFGKDPAELERILEWQRNGEAHFRSMGATVLNADRPTPKIVDDILSTIAD